MSDRPPMTQRRLRRPRFRRGETYVAVKRIQRSRTEWWEPGDEIPEGTRLAYLRRMYFRGRIGIKGDPWAEQRIESFIDSLADESEGDEGVESDDDFEESEDENADESEDGEA